MSLPHLSTFSHLFVFSIFHCLYLPFKDFIIWERERAGEGEVSEGEAGSPIHLSSCHTHIHVHWSCHSHSLGTLSALWCFAVCPHHFYFYFLSFPSHLLLPHVPFTFCFPHSPDDLPSWAIMYATTWRQRKVEGRWATPPSSCWPRSWFWKGQTLCKRVAGLLELRSWIRIAGQQLSQPRRQMRTQTPRLPRGETLGKGAD